MFKKEDIFFLRYIYYFTNSKEIIVKIEYYIEKNYKLNPNKITRTSPY